MSRERPPEPRDLGAVESEHDYGELIRRAGPAPDLPQLDVGALIDGAAPAWRGTVERRRRRRLTRLSAAALIPLVLLAGWWLSRFLEPTVGTWEGRRAAESGEFVAVGSELRRGQVLETGSERWVVQLEAEHRLRLDSGTRLTLEEADVIRLDRGAVYIDAEDPALEIRTSEASIRHIGTRYEVRILADSAVVKVRDGRVQISTTSGEVELGPGQGAEVQEGSGLEPFDAPTYGADWDWVQAARPPFGSTSATTRELLQWAADENGFELEMEQELELLTDGKPLTIRGLPVDIDPDLAMDIAQQEGAVEVRRENGKLVVTKR